MNNIAQDVIQAYEQSLVKIILYCIAELPFQFGMKRVVILTLLSHAWN